jgi:hypothetical protein
MTQPPPLQFRWPWRDYQARLLEQLPDLVADQRLHVVAAPGSGKTVLGLEVFRRLGVPTVVLSPTRTIRDQWLARLDDFLPADAADPTAWTSRDLSALRFFNSLTYQALHARTRAVDRAAGHGPADEEPDGSDDDPASDPISAGELADVASVMRAAGIGLIILDEAHHLRADWWAALQDLVSRLEGVRLVSLTATPPYDVVGAEWERYLSLCGTIDAEIAVPELVKAATLCPHEDLVWLSTCPDADRGLLSRHRRCVQNLTIELLTDEEFIAELEQHPWVEQPGQHLRALTATPATARAMLSLMRQASRPHEGLLEALGIDADDVESLEPGQWELLLAEYLFGAEWDGGPSPERRRGLATRLRRDGLLWRREVSLAAAGRGWPDLGRSPAKVRSCVELHELERRHRGEQLRQVVPTDRIAADSEQELGAWPVFRALVESAATSGDEAAARQVLVHTGRVTVFHSSVVPHVEGDAPSAPLTTEPVPELPGFVTIAATDTSRLTRGRSPDCSPPGSSTSSSARARCSARDGTRPPSTPSCSRRRPPPTCRPTRCAAGRCAATRLPPTRRRRSGTWRRSPSWHPASGTCGTCGTCGAGSTRSWAWPPMSRTSPPGSAGSSRSSRRPASRSCRSMSRATTTTWRPG